MVKKTQRAAPIVAADFRLVAVVVKQHVAQLVPVHVHRPWLCNHLIFNVFLYFGVKNLPSFVIFKLRAKTNASRGFPHARDTQCPGYSI